MVASAFGLNCSVTVVRGSLPSQEIADAIVRALEQKLKIHGFE